MLFYAQSIAKLHIAVKFSILLAKLQVVVRAQDLSSHNAIFPSGGGWGVTCGRTYTPMLERNGKGYVLKA